MCGTEARSKAHRQPVEGTAGRQGDPGSSRFYLSIEDELMRLFGGDMIGSVMEKMGFAEDDHRTPAYHQVGGDCPEKDRSS